MSDETQEQTQERSRWARFVHAPVGGKFDLAALVKATLITGVTLATQYFVVMAVGFGVVPAVLYQLAEVSGVDPNGDPTWFLILAWYGPGLFVGGFVFVATYQALAYLWRLRTHFIAAEATWVPRKPRKGVAGSITWTGQATREDSE